MTVFPLDDNCQWIVHNNTRFLLDKWCLHKKEVSHQQRWSLRDQPQQRLHHNNTGGSRHDNIRDRNNSRDGSKQGKQGRQWEHTGRQRRTRTLQNHWKARTDDTHTHKRPDLSFATQELATTNIHRAEKSEAHTEVRARYVSSPHIGKAIPGSNKAVNNEAWKSNNSRRVVEEEEHKKHYTIRNFLTETIPHEQTTNMHPHGLHQCQNHCNRNRANAPKYHTTTDTHWHTTSAQKSAC